MSGTAGPLQGTRILEFSIALTGPYAIALLADQGADVVKVERPGIGDIARWIGVAVNDMSAFFLVCNRGSDRSRSTSSSPARSRSRSTWPATSTSWSRTSVPG